jgi:hypothetical protein
VVAVRQRMPAVVTPTATQLTAAAAVRRCRYKIESGAVFDSLLVCVTREMPTILLGAYPSTQQISHTRRRLARDRPGCSAACLSWPGWLPCAVAYPARIAADWHRAPLRSTDKNAPLN